MSAHSAVDDGHLLPVTELTLSHFHLNQLDQDAAGRQFIFYREHSLWMLGDTSLWNWQPLERKLRRMHIHEPKTDGSSLEALSTDGVNLFASSHSTVYQINTKDYRVFRYPAIRNLSEQPSFFVGNGDNFLWSANNQLIKIDRYGKTLVPWHKIDSYNNSRNFVYIPEKNQILWPFRRSLIQLDLNATGKPTRILSTKQPLLDLQLAGDHFIAHTAHTVLRLSKSGRITQAIPVEGHRKLIAMHISEDRHTYLFDDQLLEIFEIETKRHLHYALPLENKEKVTQIVLSWPIIALLTDQKIRVFKLGIEQPPHSLNFQSRRTTTKQ